MTQNANNTACSDAYPLRPDRLRRIYGTVKPAHHLSWRSHLLKKPLK
jgi:hypothetical protein